MKHRNVVAVICFSIITLGIYDLFWLASTKKELNARTKEHIPSIWLLFSPILLLFVIFGIALIAALASGDNTGSNGSTGVVTTIITIVGGIFGTLGIIVIPVYWNLKYAKAVNEYTSGQLSTAVTFILLWILRFIGMAVIQDKFNDMIASGTAGGVVPMPMAMGSAPTSAAAFGVTPFAPAAQAAPIVIPGVISPQPAVPTPQPLQVSPQPTLQSQQPPVDPTNSQSYGQQVPPQPPQPPQPPVPPAGPLVQ